MQLLKKLKHLDFFIQKSQSKHFLIKWAWSNYLDVIIKQLLALFIVFFC